ncbi:hypothetical protein WOLCODRAFT_155675 [Wolfiporia cocos MD-104 SS10]|uniref:DUF6699 domain-containing protein n=1 Tax=Wolfiporia cocos (strain MD-104) TaxID=742152 RepID=A0A2H3JEA2_WOLCO|nr:hypothetical protein WOLCODRAFT_155675 [Wolfiporia cocos MD-104 SS10]
MPKKQVRFTDSDASSSPAWSIYTNMPSSPPLVNLRPNIPLPAVNPYQSMPTPHPHKVPLPVYIYPQKSIVINPTLAVRQHGGPRGWSWGMTFHPGNSFYGQRGLTTTQLAETAMWPMTSALTVCIVHPMYPWQVAVHAGRHTHVTVEDVLNGVYHNLHKRIYQKEFDAMPHRRRSEIAAAYRCRYKQLNGSEAQEKEKNQGVRRVDYLLDRRYFAGMVLRSDAYSQKEGVVLELKVGQY